MIEDRPLEPALAELDRRLRALDVELLFPGAPELADAVGVRLRGERPPTGTAAPARRRAVPRWAFAAAAAMCLALVSLFAIPTTRTTVAGWFGLDGVRFIGVEQVTVTPVGRPLALGEATSLAEAQAELSFTALLPTFDGFTDPDEVYVDPRPIGGMLSLVYAERDGLPAAEGSGVGLLLTQFRGDLNQGFISKGLPPGTTVEQVEVAGAPGIWVSEELHLFFYTDPTGAVVNEDLRLAGNTLLWQSGGLTLRLEGRLPLEEMLRIAESLRPAP